MSKRNQEGPMPVIAESVTMDSRKFLSTINSSAQSQIKFFEEAVERLGIKYDAEWKLTSLLKNRLVFEDIETGRFMIADYARQKGGKITITNLKNLEITEDKKSVVFESACHALVDAIAGGKLPEMESALVRIASNRFRGKTIPNSGLVRTKDGVVRHISVRSDRLEMEEKAALVQTILENINGKVEINEGKTTATFAKAPKLPVTELTSRRVVAYHMRERARNAYWSPNFQIMAESVAGLISKDNNDDLAKAVDVAARFLKENQEFSLLSKGQMNEVVGNTLATRGIFNESITRDTSTLFYRTGLRVNRDDIVAAWRQTAKTAEHPVMLENVSILESAKNFSEAYENFLGTIFEAVGETTREALLNGLTMLKDYVGQDPEQIAKVDDLLAKLSNEAGADDQAVWEAMDLLAQVHNGLATAQGKDLNNFDQIPGEDDLNQLDQAIDTATPPAAAANSGTPQTVININTGSGTPQISDGAAPATPSPEDDLGGLDDLDVEGDDLLGDDSLLGGEAGGGEEKPEPQLDLNSKETEKAPLNEDEQGQMDRVMEFLSAVANTDTDGVPVQEDVATEPGLDDEFTLPEGVEVTGVDAGYGLPILSEMLVKQKVADIEKLVKDRNLKPEEVNDSLDELAGTSLAGESDLKDPKRMQKAKEEVIGAYAARQAAAKQGKAVNENQTQSPTKVLAKRGLKRAAISQLVEEGKLEWTKREGDGVLGNFKGVEFLIDHANPAVLASKDGEVQIPIPEGLIPGALYLAEVSETEADADTFVEWLDQNIEQLRPISEDDEKALNEAIARLTVSPDVKVEIDVNDSLASKADPDHIVPTITEPEPAPNIPPSDTPPSEPADKKDDADGEDEDEELAEAVKDALGDIITEPKK